MFRTAYRTPLGEALIGDSMEVLPTLEPESVDLVMTSPPFALLREKEYGNRDQGTYIDWLCNFAPLVKRVLKPTGSYVLDLGGAYRRGVPVRSLYNYRVLLRHVDDHGFFLAEEFFWHNPSKLPSPIEWVNKRKLRVKDSVNTLWWLSKTEWPKADVTKVLAPYSERMKTLLKDADKFYSPKMRPSGHDISASFNKDNGGAIPPNLLQFSNTESNSVYLHLCKEHDLKPHPARFPRALPEFFIKFLTDPGDLVVDIFGGSGTTGEVAEVLGRSWKTIDISEEYVQSSIFRFLQDQPADLTQDYLHQMQQGQEIRIEPCQPQLF
jgi:site-specific DNA-methyltransferase (cytosine-N4-specific)